MNEHKGRCPFERELLAMQEENATVETLTKEYAFRLLGLIERAIDAEAGTVGYARQNKRAVYVRSVAHLQEAHLILNDEVNKWKQ